jgi:hypothetical protein
MKSIAWAIVLAALIISPNHATTEKGKIGEGAFSLFVIICFLISLA